MLVGDSILTPLSSDITNSFPQYSTNFCISKYLLSTLFINALCAKFYISLLLIFIYGYALFCTKIQTLSCRILQIFSYVSELFCNKQKILLQNFGSIIFCTNLTIILFLYFFCCDDFLFFICFQNSFSVWKTHPYNSSNFLPTARKPVTFLIHTNYEKEQFSVGD